MLIDEKLNRIKFDQVLMIREGMHRVAIRVFSKPSLYSLECTSNLINIRLNLLSDSADLNTKFIFDADFDSITDIDALKSAFFNFILDNFGVSLGSSIEMSKGRLC